MGHMAGGDMRAGGFTMRLLIVKENVRLVGSQEIGLIQAAEKDRLINTDIPGAQRTNDALMSGR